MKLPLTQRRESYFYISPSAKPMWIKTGDSENMPLSEYEEMLKRLYRPKWWKRLLIWLKSH